MTDRLLDELADILQLGGGAVGAARAEQIAEADDGDGEAVADGIVKRGSDSAALALLGERQIGCQRLETALVGEDALLGAHALADFPAQVLVGLAKLGGALGDA